MLTLLLLPVPVLLRVFLLDGMLIWPLLILWVLVFPLMLPVGSVGRKVLVLVGISSSGVLMRWLLQMLVLLLIVGSPLISLLLLDSVLMPGWLMLLARLCVNLSGLPVCWILLIGPPRRQLGFSRMSGMKTGMNSVRFLEMLCLLVGVLSLVHMLMIFGLFGVGALRRGSFGLILEPVVPLMLAVLPFLVEGCNRRLGGRAVGSRGSSRLYRASHDDEVDKHCAQFFVNSSLSPVLLFRRRLKSVADVLKGIRNRGFTQSRWDALLGCWEAVCRHGPCGPISSLRPWDDWIPPDLHGFYKWVFDSLEVLNGFVRQVVISRRDEGIRRWTRWLREDLSSRPYVWLRPDFVPPSPFLVVKDPQTGSSRILVEPHLIGAEFRKAWMPFFCRSGHPVVIGDQFLDFVGHLLPQEPYLYLPRITGRDSQEVARAKKSTAGGLDGWAWNELKALPLP